MHVIDTTEGLEAFLAKIAGDAFITVDTEFMRERTFWPKLCLVQVAGAEASALIDPLAPDIDLTALGAVLSDEKQLKVFHSGRQDIEIFYHLFGKVPHPVFDSQVAAMVLGYGEAISYDRLVKALTGHDIDKASRFTDWARRPLSKAQLVYALDDVLHLRDVYVKLSSRLKSQKREHWIAEEMAVLTDPATYTINPEEAWQRIRTRNAKPRFLAVLKELAKWRDSEAMRADIPRSRVVKDETLLEIAAALPESAEALEGMRGVDRGRMRKLAPEILAAVARGRETPREHCPKLEDKPLVPPAASGILELLRVLLKACCEKEHVAQKLVATSEDLQRLAAEKNPNIPALHGWRYEIFGSHAERLMRGEIALSAKGGNVLMIPTAA